VKEDVMASCDRNLLGQTAASGHEKQGSMPVKAEVVGAGKRPTRRGSAETFTGVVFQELLITANLPSRLGGLVDSFAPGARTAWHSHPLGETLYCVSGAGRIGFNGEPTQMLQPGDVVKIPPDTLHWHGATPDQLFVHLALSETDEKGKGTAWREHVSEAEYHASRGQNGLMERAATQEKPKIDSVGELGS
jgi:quercetin dioxygenase-like cupin family protein